MRVLSWVGLGIVASTFMSKDVTRAIESVIADKIKKALHNKV